MKRSEFRRAMESEFGAGYARVLSADLVIGELDSRTADEAIAAGVAPREVWLAICRVREVPRERWNGAGRPEPVRPA